MKLKSLAHLCLLLLLLGSTSVGMAASPATATTSPPVSYPPLNRPGPELTVPAEKLRDSLRCTSNIRDAARTPVLLNPGTGNSTPETDFGYTWIPQLTRLGIPFCTLTPPNAAMGDMQLVGEFLVHAIRTMHKLSGRKIAMLGHSQGGTTLRWALRFWPDTRSAVSDVIGLSPAHHGTKLFSESRCANGCTAAVWQLIHESPWIKALNSGAETFAGISYTNVYTHTDEIVLPSSGPDACSGCLHTGEGQITNVALQDVCPLNISEHVLIVADNVAYQLAMDALTHDGPADPNRIPRSACWRTFMPGLSLASAVPLLQLVLHAGPTLGIFSTAAGLGMPDGTTGGAPVLRVRPPLTCYATSSCG